MPERTDRFHHDRSRRIGDIGLDAAVYGAHTMGRTKASAIYRRAKNLRAVQLSNDLVRSDQHGVRNHEAESFDSLRVDDELELCRPLYR